MPVCRSLLIVEASCLP